MLSAVADDDEHKPTTTAEALARIRAIRVQLHPLGPDDDVARQRRPMIEDIATGERRRFASDPALDVGQHVVIDGRRRVVVEVGDEGPWRPRGDQGHD